MTNEDDIVEVVDDNFGAETQVDKPKVVLKKKSKAKAKKDDGPKLNDWVRIKKSGGNSLPNETIHIKLDPKTGLGYFVTNAKVKEGSDEMEGERTQMFKFTSFEIVEAD